jgi:D-alanyl-D-alanine carboxypeptidase
MDKVLKERDVMRAKLRHRKHCKFKTISRVIIIVIFIVLGIMTYRTIKVDLQIGELTLPIAFQSEKQKADTSAEWNLILVNCNHYIPDNYQVELTQLSNGKKVDSRIYPELQQMFNDARSEGLSLFVREGYRTTEDQQRIMDDKIKEYENQEYSKKEAKKMAEEYVAIPGTSEHQLGLSVDINADTTKCSSDKVYQWLDENAYKYGFVKRYPSDKTDITGISNEPWHYRYVGKDAAKTMKEKNLCLEEYLEKYK